MSVQRQLDELVADPREGLDIEIKPWLDLTAAEDRANLAQALLAIANHGGGFALIGFTDGGSYWTPASDRPADLSAYSQDLINGIVQRFAEPSFHCEVQVVEHRGTKQQHPVILVPGNHSVPIRSKSAGPANRHVTENTYYIRRPGPASEPPRTGREWDDFIGRCVRNARDELLAQLKTMLSSDYQETAVEDSLSQRLEAWRKSCLDRFGSLVEEHLAAEKPSRYAHGIWTFSYLVDGGPLAGDLNELLEILNKVEGHETGWPPWLVPTRDGTRPYSKDNLIECWLAEPEAGGPKDPGHSDFWRASPAGKLFLLRGYQEDGEDGELHRATPGSALDVALPIWRVGECLLHAQRIGSAIGEENQLVVLVTWEGLKGRTLTSWGRPRRGYVGGHTCRAESSVSSSIATRASEIRAMLPELVRRLTAPLYSAFDFYSPSPSMVASELDAMQKGSY